MRAILALLVCLWATLAYAQIGNLPTSVNVVGFGADPSGTNDSTAAIQAAIDYAFTHDATGNVVSAGSGINNVFCPAGTYKTTYPIFFDPPGGLRGGAVWNSGVTYNAGDIVTFNSILYVSRIGSNFNNQPDIAPIDWSSSVQWNSGTTYAAGAMVLFKGVPWYSLAGANTNNTPAATSAFWQSTSVQSNQFSFGDSFWGPPGMPSGQASGCLIFAQQDTFVAFYVGGGNGNDVENVSVVTNASGVHCGLGTGGAPNPANRRWGAGFWVPSGGGGANRTKLKNVSATGEYTGISVGQAPIQIAGAQGSLGAENRLYDVTITGACYGIGIFSLENFINEIYNGTVCGTTGLYMGGTGPGALVDGGNWSCGGDFTPSASFPITISSVTANLVVTGTLTPDVFFATTCSSITSCGANAYNAFMFKTPDFGVIPFQMTSYNIGTHVATFAVYPVWFSRYGNTCCNGIAAEVQALTKVYATEMVTTFSGTGMTINNVHIENPNAATTMVNSIVSYGAPRPNIMTNPYLNYQADQAPPASPSDGQLALYYAQSEFPFISISNAPLEIAGMSFGGLMADYLMVEAASTNMLRWHGAAPALNFRIGTAAINFTYASGNASADRFTTTDSYGFGIGIFDTPPLPSYAFTQADKFRYYGWEQTPYWGIRPAGWATPCIVPSQYTVLQSLPAITSTGSPPTYTVGYPLLWGGQQYRLCDWNLGLQTHYGLISNHFGYSYGQNLTTTNVPSLSWSSFDSANAVNITDSSGNVPALLFPGLAFSLTGTGGAGCPGTTETFMLTEVHLRAGYVRMYRANDGSPYFPVWGNGNVCTGAVLGQAAYSFTNLN